jgi:hypothetical protein
MGFNWAFKGLNTHNALRLGEPPNEVPPCTETPKHQGLRWMTLLVLGLGFVLVKTSTFTKKKNSKPVWVHVTDVRQAL